MPNNSPRSLIQDAAIVLKEIMLVELGSIGDAMISTIIGRARGLPPSERLRAIKELPWKGENAYLAKMKEAIAEVSLDAFAQVRKEIPAAKRVKFDEALEAMQLASAPETALEKLPAWQRRFVEKQAQLLVGTQLKDLETNVLYQYTYSFDTTDDLAVVEDDLRKAAYSYIDGNAPTAGANLLAAKTVNEARNGFFFEPDVLEELDAFEFVNGDPVTPICQDLAGTVFSKDDPEMFRYTPPLHWNCKSWIRPVLKGKLAGALDRAGQDKIEALKPSTKKIEESIQFSEKYLTENPCCPHA